MTPTILLVLLISSTETIAQVCLKHMFLDPQKYWLYIAAVLCYAIVCILLFVSYRYNGMGILHVLWSSVSILLAIGIGIFYFHEKITSLDKIGIVLILLGMIFVLWEGEIDHFAVYKKISNVLSDTTTVDANLTT
jgi:drug/metabolite transporter (DMT)-like permease